MTQPSLLDAVARQERPRKRVRAVSRAQYAALRDGNQLSKRAADVLRELAAFYNRTAYWPTAAELTRWMFEHRDLPRDDSRLIAPRLTEFSRGVKDRTTGVYRGGGLVDNLPARPCQVAGKKAHPYRITEAGAKFVVGQ
jgi:hypothetical protein